MLLGTTRQNSFRGGSLGFIVNGIRVFVELCLIVKWEEECVKSYFSLLIFQQTSLFSRILLWLIDVIWRLTILCGSGTIGQANLLRGFVGVNRQ